MKSKTQAGLAAGFLFAVSTALPLANPSIALAAPSNNPFARVFASGQAQEPSDGGTLHDVYSITMIARDTQFIPSVLKVKAGSKIQIRFRNEGKQPHNITFRTLPYRSSTIESGQETTFDMVAPAPGHYAFYCSVGNHAELGMTGTLNVMR